MKIDGPKNDLISEKLLMVVVSGCVQTMRRIGKLGDSITSFSIWFKSQNRDTVPGPYIEVRFLDALKEECSYETNFRFIGSGNPDPTGEEIADALCDKDALPYAITEHLKRCTDKKSLNTKIIKATEAGLMD